MASVIFLQNVKGVAQIGDVKNVTDGYARNFLLPRNLAKLATPGTLKETEKLRQKRELVSAREKETSGLLAEKLGSYFLKIEKMANNEGTLYDGLDSVEISHHLKKEGYKIEPEAVKLDHPIKKIGDYEVKIDLGYDTEAGLKISVSKKEE